MNDHVKWIKGNLKYFEQVFEAKAEESKKWKGLAMDYGKLESFRNHLKNVSEWERFRAYQLNVSTGGKVYVKPQKNLKPTPNVSA